LVKGTDYQDELDEISYRVRALDPDLMSDEEVRRLRAERDRLKALPAEPYRWEEQLTGVPVLRYLPGAPRLRARRVAEFPRVRGPRDEETGQRDLGRRERDSSSRVTVVCSGMKARITLRRQVATAAAAANSEDEFFARLGRAGVLVRKRFSVKNTAEVTGYSVALPGDTAKDGGPVWYGGGKLAADLTWPKLRQR
jgi:hypothetical protein